jgi:hypothetical protein
MEAKAPMAANEMQETNEAPQAGGVIGQPPPSGSSISDVPPQLIPVLMQLSDDEKMVGLQVFQQLDLGSIKNLTDRLLAMPQDSALKTIKTMIKNARLRSASVAHRAVSAALREEEESRTNGSTVRPSHGSPSRPNGGPSNGGAS